MAEKKVVSETVILSDKDGNETKDPKKAVMAEITQKMSDGTTLSTIMRAPAAS
jgi:hypothetical protein